MQKKIILVLLFISIITSSWKSLHDEWLTEKNKSYTLFYLEPDKKNIDEYKEIMNNGIKSVQDFFNEPYKNEFEIYIHPNRKSLDTQWQKDWKMPEFKSECWMVASGIGTKLDVISPKTWDSESCEHKYSEKEKTQQLITHELFHVYHGQLNVSPDFSDVDNIDWFVEGLATYASGQCDAQRMAAVKAQIAENKTPKTLDEFWTGKNKYGLSGSVVMYLDNKFGRIKLKELLPLNKKQQILAALNLSEQGLLADWMHYVEKYSSDH